MVARHNRPDWSSANRCVCIDCGARYLLTNTYKGNYCPDCHEAWVARQRDESATERLPARFAPPRPGIDGEHEDSDGLDDPYDAA